MVEAVQSSQVPAQAQVPAQQVQPAQQTPAEGQIPAQSQSEDVIKRATAFKPEGTKLPEKPEDGMKFDYSEIEKIQDPQAKEWAMKAYKSMLRGVDKTLQETAHLRKEYESRMANASSWTPEKINELLNNPEFVKAANAAVGGSEEPESNLSENDRAELKKIKEAQEHLLRQQYESRKQIFDQQLSQRYSNYDSSKLDMVEANVLAGKVVPNREDFYKALYHDENVRNAYELGKKDGMSKADEKVNASSGMNGGVQMSGGLELDPKESTQSFIQRIIQKNLSMVNKK